MQNLSQITEQLASAVVMADPSDLPALAQVHEQLLTLVRLAAEEGGIDPARLASLQKTASSAESLVEKIVLREVQDAAGALQQVCSAIKEIQGLMEPGAGPANEPAIPEPQEPIAAAPVSPAPAAQAAPPAGESPINPDDAPLVQEFISESMGHIESAEASVLQIEENPEDLEAVNAIFRSFHTIKGVAGFLNLKQIGSLAHAAESLLDLARNGKLQLEGAIVDVVLEAIDLLKAMIGSLTDALKTNTPPAPQEKLPALLEKLHAAADGTLSASKTAPAAPETATAPATPAPAAPATVAATPAAPTAAPAAPAAPKSKPSASAAPAGKPAEGKASHGGSGDATVKVATDRLDSLINMVGELVIAQAMVRQDLHHLAGDNQRAARNIGHLGKITRELQDLSMSMRMVPIQGVFQKMARLVRDLARKAGKEIDFEVVGGETELDRNVVEAISDPLVHMVRNSVDHGIEPPEDRAKAGKARAGKVELKAYHQAGNIVIEITDDGRGLNKAKLVKKATEAGIIREGQELSEQEIFKLIFHPGLSTAEKVTDISGRGVGMDVVKRNVEALRGRIDIASVEGKGSTFSIRLPLTLAIIDGQIVKVGHEKYIIPITSIEQSVQPRPEQISTVQDRGEMCMVRGNLLPLFRLYRLFGVKPVTEDPTKALVVIVQDDEKRCCLLVDELLGQQQVVIKSLGDMLGHLPGISGGAILGDGNISLILDIPGLIHTAIEESGSAAENQ